MNYLQLTECIEQILKDFAVCEFNDAGTCIKRYYFKTEKEAKEFQKTIPNSKIFTRCECGRFGFENPDCEEK